MCTGHVRMENLTGIRVINKGDRVLYEGGTKGPCAIHTRHLHHARMCPHVRAHTLHSLIPPGLHPPGLCGAVKERGRI